LLRAELQARGHRVQGVQFNAKPLVLPSADVNIFDEVVVPLAFTAAPVQWVMPHPEWWLTQYHVCLPRFAKVLCKTHDCVRLFRPLAGTRVEYLGFMSRDLYRPEIVRHRTFLHVAGNSAVKNTEAVLSAWTTLPYDLTLVTHVPRLLHLAAGMPRVTVRSRVPEAEFTDLFNRHQFHLCPSQYEGFGHIIHEAMGVGAVVMTRNGPPMDEFGIPTDLLVPSRVKSHLRLADMRTVTPEAVAKMVRYVAELSPETIEAISRQMRLTFETSQAEFQQRLSAVLDQASTSKH
jgi:hypothetical protein